MPSSAYVRKRPAQDRSIRICSLLSQVVLGLVLTLPAFAQTTPQQRYVISIGPNAEKVRSGAIWLYSLSYYGLQKLQLATIENGVALLPLDTGMLKRELDPHPNTNGYVVALQIGEHLWYRTPNISPDVVWNDLPGAVNSLGRATALSAGETQLILPSPTKRHVTLLYPDGRPPANANIGLSIYLWDNNHCKAHMGLPLGTLRTDKTGTIEVLAPLVALYLDISYYENAGSGPAGVITTPGPWPPLLESESMATVTEARTSRKPIRTVRVSVKPTEMNPFTIIVIREPKHSDHYMVSPIPADFGTAYKVEKFMDSDSPTYHVNVADNDTFTCECIQICR